MLVLGLTRFGGHFGVVNAGVYDASRRVIEYSYDAHDHPV